MGWAFPLSFGAFANILPVQSFRWDLQRFEESSGTGRGDILISEIAVPKWRAYVALRPMLPTQAAALEAMAEVLGSGNTFSLFDLRKAGPLHDPDGSVLGSATVTVHTVGSGGKSFRLKGLPSGYHLTRGDMMSVSYNGRRALHRIVENAIASGIGITPEFEVRPHVKIGTAVNDPVLLRKPWAKMQMTGYDYGDLSGRFVTGAGFSAIEAY